MDGLLGLDCGNGGLRILWPNISSIQQTASHVLAFLGITFDHLVATPKAREGHLRNGVLFMSYLFRRKKRSEGGQREMDARERNEVGLELVQVDVERPIKSEGGSDG